MLVVVVVVVVLVVVVLVMLVIVVVVVVVLVLFAVGIEPRTNLNYIKGKGLFLPFLRIQLTPGINFLRRSC